MKAKSRKQLQRAFVARLVKRWETGAREYGDGSFFEAPLATVEQILAEVEDIAGWSFILWTQLQIRLGRVVLQAAKIEPSHEQTHQRAQALIARLNVAQKLGSVPACPKSRTSSRRKPARSSRRSRARS